MKKVFKSLAKSYGDHEAEAHNWKQTQNLNRFSKILELGFKCAFSKLNALNAVSQVQSFYYERSQKFSVPNASPLSLLNHHYP